MGGSLLPKFVSSENTSGNTVHRAQISGNFNTDASYWEGGSRE